MLIRDLSDEWLSRPPRFLAAVADNWDLQPEIRDNSVTIYSRGVPLFRDIQIQNGKITGHVHYLDVPIEHHGRYQLSIAFEDDGGFEFENDPVPIAPGNLESTVVDQYTRQLELVRPDPKFDIIHQLVRNPRNFVVDQQIEIHGPNDVDAPTVDIVHYDTYLGCFAFVKVASVDEARLRSDQNGVVKLFDQFDRIVTRIDALEDPFDSNAEKLREILNRVVRLKRKIGLGRRVAAVPSEGVWLLAKPVLVIGNCSNEDVTAILNGQGEWELFLKQLESHAAGLILCNPTDGCLSLHPGRKTIVFDQRLLTWSRWAFMLEPNSF